MQVENVPNYLAASTPQGLRQLCFKTNLRLGGQVLFHSFQFVDGQWYCWFTEKISVGPMAPKEVKKRS